MTELLFTPFQSSCDVAFWHALTEKKLDIFKLSDAPVAINGAYCVGSNEAVPPRIVVESKVRQHLAFVVATRILF
jgi:hypothetical protein